MEAKEPKVQAVVIHYTKKLGMRRELQPISQAIYETAAEAVKAVEEIEKARGVVFAWAETQIGYQVSEEDVDWEDMTEMWEISGWEDGGICELPADEDED